MAYLNVQQRRIETKIAYVGPELAGKATNLRQLRDDSSRGRSTNAEFTGDVLSLEWMPLSSAARFRDCDVAVKVVSPKGTLSTESLDEILDGADGVVVVVDAAPSASDENRRALDLVRDAVSRSGTPLPVVVQLNKSDLADAISPTAIQTNLEWPVVPASAVRGEGVLETLEVALSNVMEAFNKRQVAPPPAEVSASPLLDALRDILRETVAEHVTALEGRLAARVVAGLSSKVDELRAAVDEVGLRVDEIQTRTRNALTRSDLSAATSDLVTQRSLDSTLSHLVSSVELAASLSEIAKTSELESALGELVTKKELEEHELRLREDAANRVKLERDSSAAQVKKAVDPLLAGVKKEIADLHTKVDALASPMSTSLKGIPARLDQLENAIQREFRGVLGSHLTRVDESVQAMHSATTESLTRSEAKAGEIHAGLTELLTELKKQKKGWFS